MKFQSRSSSRTGPRRPTPAVASEQRCRCGSGCGTSFTKNAKGHTDQQLSDLMQEVADSFRGLRLYTAAALCQETAMRLRSKKRLAKPRR